MVPTLLDYQLRPIINSSTPTSTVLSRYHKSSKIQVKAAGRGGVYPSLRKEPTFVDATSGFPAK